MKQVGLLITALFLTCTLQAQKSSSSEIRIDSKDGEYHVRIKKNHNGESSVVDKYYHNLADMQDDPELNDFESNFDDDVMNSFFDEDSSLNMNFDFDDSLDTSPGFNDFIGSRKHHLFFDNDEPLTINDLKVWTDEDGNIHIKQNGKDMTFKDGESNKDNIDKGAVERHDIIKGDKLDHKSSNGKDFDFSPKANGSFSNISLEDFSRQDLRTHDLFSKKKLKLDNFMFYPDPVKKKARLVFEAAKKPVRLVIFSREGKQVYLQEINAFKGKYDSTIDLSSVGKGIFMLEINQANKATRRKLVIE